MLKKLTTTLISLILLFGLNPSIVFACGFDFVGDCATSAQLSINGVKSEYFISNCPYGQSFKGNLGSHLTELKLNYASTRTWESCTNNVVQGVFWYRIYSNAAAKGSFQKVNLTQKTMVENPPYRTKLYYDNLSINLLSNLRNNTFYTMEVYFEVNVDSDGNGIPDTLGIKNNSGAYYSVQFQTGIIHVEPPIDSAQQSVSQDLPVIIKSIPTSLVDDNLSVAVESFLDKEIGFIIYNAMGKTIKVEKKILEKGLNHIRFDVWGLQSGMYFIVPSTHTIKNAPTKFVKI